MNTTYIIPLIVSICLLSYHIINVLLFNNRVKKFTLEYKLYFYKEHVNKKPFLYIFCTMFMLIYQYYHEEDFKYGYLKYLVKKIDDTKIELSTYGYINVNFEIENEDKIRQNLHNFELQLKLKNIKKSQNGN